MFTHDDLNLIDSAAFEYLQVLHREKETCKNPKGLAWVDSERNKLYDLRSKIREEHKQLSAAAPNTSQSATGSLIVLMTALDSFEGADYKLLRSYIWSNVGGVDLDAQVELTLVPRWADDIRKLRGLTCS